MPFINIFNLRFEANPSPEYKVVIDEMQETIDKFMAYLDGKPIYYNILSYSEKGNIGRNTSEGIDYTNKTFINAVPESPRILINLEKTFSEDLINSNKKIVVDDDVIPELDSDNMDGSKFIYVMHQTDEVGAKNILSKGFDIKGGLNGTTLLANKQAVDAAIKSMEEGHGHRGANTLIVYAFPNNEFNNARQLDAISDQLIDKGIFTIPKEYLFGAKTVQVNSQPDVEILDNTVPTFTSLKDSWLNDIISEDTKYEKLSEVLDYFENIKGEVTNKDVYDAFLNELHNMQLDESRKLQIFGNMNNVMQLFAEAVDNLDKTISPHELSVGRNQVKSKLYWLFTSMFDDDAKFLEDDVKALFSDC